MGDSLYDHDVDFLSGYVFGPSQPLILQLLDITPMMGVLKGVEMEIQDCSLPLVREVISTDAPEVAFKVTYFEFPVPFESNLSFCNHGLHPLTSRDIS